MKLYFLLMILVIFCATPSLAQKKFFLQPYRPVQFMGSIRYYLDEIRVNTGMVIEYSANHFDIEKLIFLQGNENTVGSVLKKVLHNQKLRLLEKNGKIILIPSSTILDTDALVSLFSVFGFVKMQGNEEPLVDVSIIDVETGKGFMTNAYGYYHLALSPGKHLLQFSCVGFQAQTVQLDLNAPLRSDITLEVNNGVAPVIVIKSQEFQKDAAARITPGMDAVYDYFTIENDPLRTAYTIPGVKNIPESFNGILVRGGGANENLFLLDGTPVYNPTHMLGTLSIVNPTSMKTMRMYKNDFPSRFDGAISSVIDVYTKDGDMKNWHGEANFGVLAGSIGFEGPIKEGKTALMGSFRHSAPSFILKFFQKGIQPDFYDAHVKVTHLLSKKDKVMMNIYKGEDQIRQLNERVDNLHKWGNVIGALSWNRLLGAKSFVNSSLNMSQYENLGSFQYTLYDGMDQGRNVVFSRSLGTFSSIAHYLFKSQAQIHISNTFTLNAGTKVSRTILKPFETLISTDLEENKRNFASYASLTSNEFSGNAEGEVKIKNKVFIRPGLTVSAYQHDDFVFQSIQPRFFVSGRISKGQFLFASFNIMNQYLHLVTNPYLGPNSDIWVPSSKLLKPEQSMSFNLGYSFRKKREFRFSIDGYFKRMYNITNYAEGKSYFVNSRNWQQNIESGKGQTYGIETMFEKRNDKLSFRAAYTLAWSFRRFKSINNGYQFPYKYDRRHDVNAGLSFQLNKKFNSSILWSFATGDMFSLPDQIYPDYDLAQQVQTPDDVLQNYQFIYHFSEVNKYRTAPYQRLDAALNYHVKAGKASSLSITGGIYTIYGSPDQYSYDLKGSLVTRRIVIEIKDRSIYISPNISCSLKF